MHQARRRRRQQSPLPHDREVSPFDDMGDAEHNANCADVAADVRLSAALAAGHPSTATRRLARSHTVLTLSRFYCAPLPSPAATIHLVPLGSFAQLRVTLFCIPAVSKAWLSSVVDASEGAIATTRALTADAWTAGLHPKIRIDRVHIARPFWEPLPPQEEFERAVAAWARDDGSPGAHSVSVRQDFFNPHRFKATHSIIRSIHRATGTPLSLILPPIMAALSGFPAPHIISLLLRSVYSAFVSPLRARCACIWTVAAVASITKVVNTDFVSCAMKLFSTVVQGKIRLKHETSANPERCALALAIVLHAHIREPISLSVHPAAMEACRKCALTAAFLQVFHSKPSAAAEMCHCMYCKSANHDVRNCPFARVIFKAPCPDQTSRAPVGLTRRRIVHNPIPCEYGCGKFPPRASCRCPDLLSGGGGRRGAEREAEVGRKDAVARRSDAEPPSLPSPPSPPPPYSPLRPHAPSHCYRQDGSAPSDSTLPPMEASASHTDNDSPLTARRSPIPPPTTGSNDHSADRHSSSLLSLPPRRALAEPASAAAASLPLLNTDNNSLAAIHNDPVDSVCRSTYSLPFPERRRRVAALTLAGSSAPNPSLPAPPACGPCGAAHHYHTRSRSRHSSGRGSCGSQGRTRSPLGKEASSPSTAQSTSGSATLGGATLGSMTSGSATFRALTTRPQRARARSADDALPTRSSSMNERASPMLLRSTLGRRASHGAQSGTNVTSAPHGAQSGLGEPAAPGLLHAAQQSISRTAPNASAWPISLTNPPMDLTVHRCPMGLAGVPTSFNSVLSASAPVLAALPTPLASSLASYPDFAATAPIGQSSPVAYSPHPLDDTLTLSLADIEASAPTATSADVACTIRGSCTAPLDTEGRTISASIQGERVDFLVDGGQTYNSISSQFLAHLRHANPVAFRDSVKFFYSHDGYFDGPLAHAVFRDRPCALVSLDLGALGRAELPFFITGSSWPSGNGIGINTLRAWGAALRTCRTGCGCGSDMHLGCHRTTNNVRTYRVIPTFHEATAALFRAGGVEAPRP